MRRLLLCLVVLLSLVPLHAATTKFSDLFTNTGGATEQIDAQVNHITNIGASPFWSELVDSQGSRFFAAIVADMLVIDTAITANRLLWVATPSTALSSSDYDVSILVETPPVEGQADDDDFCVFGRMADATHGYGVCVNAQADPQAIRIIELNGANTGLTPLATGTFNVAVNDVIKLSMRGDTIKGWVNGVQKVCVVDATQTATGQGGFGVGNFINVGADQSASSHYDNFLIEDATGDGGDDNCASGAVTPRTILGVFP